MSTKHYVTGMDAPDEDDGEDPLWEGHDGYPVDIHPLGSGCITYWTVDSEGDTWAACDTHGTLRMWDLEDSRVLDVRASAKQECESHWVRHYRVPRPKPPQSQQGGVAVGSIQMNLGAVQQSP